MTVGFTKQELASILDGFLIDALEESVRILDFEIDPRHLQPSKRGNCFISISKERWNQFHQKELSWVDGNTRILTYDKQTDLIITEKPIDMLKSRVPQLIVEDSIAAIRTIAIYAREKMKHPVIGITGSVGKSSTRLIIEHLLQDTHDLVATRGNHNTQIGVPLYGAKLCTNPDIGILEVSLNALNNRGNQSRTIKPDVCIITSIGEAHLSTLHSTMNIAMFKARILKGLQPGGLVVLNRDMERKEFDILYREAKKRTNWIKTYSISDSSADLYLKNRFYRKYTTVNILEYKHQEYRFEMKMPSVGMVMNTLGAVLCLAELGYDLANVLPKTYDFKSLDRVMELKRLTTKDWRRIDVLDDSHNAAIPSMLNAIQTFREKQFFYKGKKILVLGQVADLGEQSEALHEKLLPAILDSRADVVFGHGMYMREVIRKLPANMVGGWFNHALDLAVRLPYYCSDDSLILLKGSVSGSDFRKISYYLPGQISRSTKEIKPITPESLAATLQPMWGAIGYHLAEDKLIFQDGYGQTKSIEGMAPLILLMLLFKQGIQEDTISRLHKWPTNKGRSLYQKPFRRHQDFNHRELVEELAMTQHPSAVYELAYAYFGSRKEALLKVHKLASQLEVAPSAVLNLTGRYRVKEQQFFTLDDLLQASKALASYQSQLPMIMKHQEKAIRGIRFGHLRTHCILFMDEAVICISGMKNEAMLRTYVKQRLEKTSKRADSIE